MRERAGERAAKYLEATSQSLRLLKKRKNETAVPSSLLDYVLELARGYARDAKHYVRERKPVTALACIAYAEGLLDALKFLELAEF
jgi:FAD synthetase